MKKDNQVKSKRRVADYGEVLTHQREINSMLNLVKQETERIDSRFLEPACGNGNFLTEILTRKLEVVNKRYLKSQFEWERYSIIAITSIYGIDILQDNVQECRLRLFQLFDNQYSNLFKGKCKEDCLKTVRFILKRNILWGDALSLKIPNEKKDPIVFSEWSAVNGSFMKRRDYTFANLLQSQSLDMPNLFSDLGDKAFIPTPVGDFPLTHFLKLGENDTD